MRALYDSFPTPMGSGWQVLVIVEPTDEEHCIIYQNRMSLSDKGTLEIAEYRGQKLYFGNFYDGRINMSVWDFDSSY